MEENKFYCETDDTMYKRCDKQCLECSRDKLSTGKHFTELVYGDLISWQYTHWLNSKSSTQRVKKGIFIRLSKPKKDERFSTYAIVKFEGNKGYSRIYGEELKYLKTNIVNVAPQTPKAE